MKVPWWQVDMGISSQEAVRLVAESKSYSMGKYCATLEEDVARERAHGEGHEVYLLRRERLGGERPRAQAGCERRAR